MGKRHSAFYLDRRIAEKVGPLVEKYGGVVTPVLTGTCHHLMPFPPKAHVPEIISHPVYSYLFIIDSTRLLELQNLNDYLLTTQPSAQKRILGRNAYTYEDERRIYDYVQRNSKVGISALPYWVKAKEELGGKHPPESLRFHYKHYTSKMRFNEAGSKRNTYMQMPATEQTEFKQEEDEYSNVTVTVWPRKISLPSLKREIPAPPNFHPLKTVKSETDESLSPCTLSSTSQDLSQDYMGEHAPAGIIASMSQLSLVSEPSFGETEHLVSFRRLFTVCCSCSSSQLLEREVLRVLLHFQGDVKSTVQFYASSEPS